MCKRFIFDIVPKSDHKTCQNPYLSIIYYTYSSSGVYNWI